MSIQPYEARSFRFIEMLTIGPSRTGIIWRMKLYGIAHRGELPRRELLESAKRIAANQLRKETVNNYKVGFIGAHDGSKASFVFVDFWGNENELFHRVFISRCNDPSELRPAENSDPSVCVWDLRLQAFERETWIKHILCKADAPDFDGYLAERLNEKA